MEKKLDRGHLGLLNFPKTTELSTQFKSKKKSKILEFVGQIQG